MAPPAHQPEEEGEHPEGLSHPRGSLLPRAWGATIPGGFPPPFYSQVGLKPGNLGLEPWGLCSEGAGEALGGPPRSAAGVVFIKGLRIMPKPLHLLRFPAVKVKLAFFIAINARTGSKRLNRCLIVHYTPFASPV